MIRLVYLSERTTSGDSNALLAMCGKFAVHNAMNGISGLLLVAGRHYLQFLEGPDDAVRDLMVRIFADRRHTNLIVLSELQTEIRLFADWAMRGIQLDRDIPLDAAARASLGRFVHDAARYAGDDKLALSGMLQRVVHKLSWNPSA